MESKICPYCQAGEEPIKLLGDSIFEVFECVECGNNFEIKKT